MTDLTGKFAALNTSIAGRLDTIIARLDTINSALSTPSSNADIIDAIVALRGSGTENTIAVANALLIRLIAQFDTQAIVPTMKDLLMTISAQQAQIALNTNNPLTTAPLNVCLSPFTSTGTRYAPVSIERAEAQTVATWQSSAPGDFLVQEDGGSIVYCADWTQHRIYVASRSSQFGVWTDDRRFNTNEWTHITHSGYLEFFVIGDEGLQVYICPVSSDTGLNEPPTGLCGPWARQEEWSDLGVHSFYTGGATLTPCRVFAPIFSTGAPLQFNGHTLKFVGSGSRYIINVVESHIADICIGWNTTGRSVQPIAVYRRCRLLQSSWFSTISNGEIGSEPWIGSSGAALNTIDGYTTMVENNSIGSAGFTNDDFPVEYIVLYDENSSGPTDLDFFISARD